MAKVEKMRTELRHMLYCWMLIIPLAFSIFITAPETFGLLLLPLIIGGGATIYLLFKFATETEEDKQIHKMFKEMKLKP